MQHEKLKFVLCYKVDCTPELAVYKTFIRYFKENIDIENVEKRIIEMDRQKDMLEQAYDVWKSKFGK